MSSNAEMIEEFGEWHRLDDPAAMASCPHCGHDLTDDRLLHEDGVWALAAEDEATAR